MTTIAYRDGTMASDSRAYTEARWPLGVKVKIRRLTDGTLVGCSTRQVGVPDAVIDWFAEGMPGGPQSLKDRCSLTPDVAFELLAVGRDGIGTYLDGNGLPTRAKAPFYSIGSGDDYALGAMAAGKTAVEAVLIACRFDAWSAAPIYAATHDRDPADMGPLREVA